MKSLPHRLAQSLSFSLLLAACAPQLTDIERAINLMRSHVAADVTITVEPGTTKLFNGDARNTYLCGRATVNQPGIADNLVQRFIVTASKEIDRGFGRFESSREADLEFVEQWAKHCPSYTLPAVAVGARGPAAAQATPHTNFDPASKTASSDQMADPWRAIQALRQLQVKKGEFEKSDAFKARMTQMNTSTLYDDVKLSRNVAFEASDKTFITYNADKETLTYEASLNAGRVTLARRPLAATAAERIDSIELDSWKRMYQNEHHTTLAFEEEASLKFTGLTGADYVSAQVKVPAQRAAQLKGKLRIVYVGAIVAPYYGEDGYMPEPYRGSTAVLFRMIPFKLKEVWLIDGTTGEVLSRTFKTRNV